MMLIKQNVNIKNHNHTKNEMNQLNTAEERRDRGIFSILISLALLVGMHQRCSLKAPHEGGKP